MAVNGLRLYGVATLEHADERPLVDSTSIVAVRDIAAIVRPSAYAIPALDDSELLDCERVVAEVFRTHTILPAPCGTVFRSEDALQRWLDLNYVSLIEGIHFVDGRCEVRVHAIDRHPETSELAEADPAALGADAFRTLRRHAIAALPLRPEEGRVMSGAFLVERAEVPDFERHMREQERRVDRLKLQLTGPWPPYDFVRMDFGV
jgi:hypothetical protein